jgi:acetyltransferase-like isoleucine patch superfamily enzyme
MKTCDKNTAGGNRNRSLKSRIGDIYRFILRQKLRCNQFLFYLNVKTSGGKIVCRGAIPTLRGSHRPVISIENGGKLIFGKNCVLGSFSPADRVRIRVGANALLQIGEDSFINAAGINAMNRVIIGDHVMMAGIINDSNFHPVGQVSKYRQGPGEVIIKDCAWVGAGARIGPGAELGEYSILSQGSVLEGRNAKIPDLTVAKGIPAVPSGKIRVRDRSGPGRWIRRGYDDPRLIVEPEESADQVKAKIPEGIYENK